MAWRVALGALWIVGLTAILYLDGRFGGTAAPLTLLLALAVTGRAGYELFALLQGRDLDISPWTVCVGPLLCVGGTWIGQLPAIQQGLALKEPGVWFWPMTALTAATMWSFFRHARQFRCPGRVLESLAMEVFAVVYLGVLLSFAVALHGSCAKRVPQAPLLPLLSLLATAKGSDTGAYAVGRLFGRHPLALVLSPRKTLEGALGGLISAVLAAMLVFRTVPHLILDQPPVFSLSWIIVFGVAIGLAGQGGDLAESLIKRDAGQKDSAKLMPGLGGMLDLLDSILMAAPVAYVFWIFRW